MGTKPVDRLWLHPTLCGYNLYNFPFLFAISFYFSKPIDDNILHARVHKQKFVRTRGRWTQYRVTLKQFPISPYYFLVPPLAPPTTYCRSWSGCPQGLESFRLCSSPLWAALAMPLVDGRSSLEHCFYMELPFLRLPPDPIRWLWLQLAIWWQAWASSSSRWVRLSWSTSLRKNETIWRSVKGCTPTTISKQNDHHSILWTSPPVEVAGFWGALYFKLWNLACECNQIKINSIDSIDWRGRKLVFAHNLFLSRGNFFEF